MTRQETTDRRPKVAAEEYARAEELWPSELLGRVTNALVIPNWLPDQDRFWFKLEHLDRHEYLLVDAATGDRRPAFDHKRIAEALNEDQHRLPIDTLEYDGDDIVVRVEGRDGRLRIDGDDGRVTEVPDRDPNAFRGPGGDELFVRAHDLWIRDLQGRERQLTDDGEEFYGWAEGPDGDYDRIGRDRTGTPPSTIGCFWSPDGTRALVPRADERAVTAYPYLENVPHDGDLLPKVHHVRRKMIGDAEDTRWEWYVIDVSTGARVTVGALPWDLQILPWHAWWTRHDTVIALASTAAQDCAAAVEIDAATGAVRVIHLEHDHMFRLNSVWFHDDNVRYLPERGELIWFSYASGYPHLWVIDLASGSLRQLTDGAWAVQDLVRVTGRYAFFTAGGVEPGRNPYLRSLYRVDLDGAGPNAGLRCLTPEDADHAFPPVPQGTVSREWGVQPWELRSCMSPSGRYFVDNISRVDLAPVVMLRDADGRTIGELARADISGLLSIGWTYPETFRAKAADGETDIWGVIIKPRRFAERDSWPVLERIYGPPQVLAQPRSFLEGLNGMFLFGLHSLAEMGFGVVLMDAPGTPHRSRAFRDMTWGEPDRFGIKNHRAAIEDIARTRPWMDLSRVGISGHSSGGYATVMAMLLEPDFYQVGFSSSPALDPSASYATISEAHFGKPDYGDGRAVRRTPDEAAPNYEELSPNTYAGRLIGRLMLVYGDLDEECEPPALIQFVDSLVRAGKEPDLLVLPNQSHFYTPEPYYQKRLWDYFVEHVQGREPLRHHPLSVTRGERLHYT
ncbi:DPP IV N-terminal domain-containing protein [Streptomyces sp. NPDC048425]|uniref:S9 family peptidase n=1 Tax=Streptomyces sp. NPDC048425 TaxID=3365548 RepID=UPI003718C557